MASCCECLSGGGGPELDGGMYLGSQPLLGKGLSVFSGAYSQERIAHLFLTERA